MPVQVNPYLRTESDEATTTEESPEAVIEAPSGEESAGSADQFQSPDSVGEQPTEDEQFWKLDRRNPLSDFQRLLQENPDLANKYNADIGRKAKRKYEPEIEKERARAEAAEAQLNQLRFRDSVSRMAPEQVQQRLQSDRDFATQYHNARQNLVPDVAARTEQIEWSRAIEDAIDYGISNGLPDESETAIKQAIAQGRYDYEYDQRGQPLRLLSQPEGLLRLQRDVADAVAYLRSQQGRPAAAAPPPAAQPVAAPVTKPSQPIGLANQAIQQGADVSGGMAGRPSPRISRDEVNQMRHSDFKSYLERWPTQEDYIRDIQNGVITD